MMGGLGAHEYMAPCAAGENDVALAPGYAANVEIASADPQPVELPAGARRARARSRRPGLTTVEQVAGALGVARGRAAEGLPGGARRPASCVMVVVRGDHRVNEIKLRNALGDGLPARAPRRGRRAHRAAGLHRPGRGQRADPARRRRRTGAATSPAPTSPTPTCAASSRAATSRSSAPTCAAWRRATRSAATRSASSPRSRSATSSSSARATRSRSAPPTWTSTARSS